MPRSALFPVAVAATLLAGCGSTVATSADGTGVRAPGTVDGLAAPGAGSTSTGPLGGNPGGGPAGRDGLAPNSTNGLNDPAAPDTTGGSGRQGDADNADGTTRGTGSGAAPSSTGSGGQLRQGVGVTATAVNLGIVYTENAEAANAAFGVNLAAGDTKANAQAIIDEINARGGVAGRKLVPVFHAYDAQSSDTNASQDQAACEDLTRDHQVFAVAGSGLTETWDACMKKAGVLNTVGATLTESDRPSLAARPHYFNANAPVRDRVESALVPALLRQKYFSGWDSARGAPGPAKPVVGVIGYNVPEWERPLNSVLLPKLKAAGHPVQPQNIARITAPTSQAEQGPAIAEVGNTVLRFRQNGVTHLVLIDTGGGLTLVFTAAAKNQSYYPRLGVTSGSGLQGLYDAGTFGDRELAGAIGLGWAPSIDLPATAGDKYANAATRDCLSVLKKRTGQQYASSNEASIALGQCDEIHLAAEAIRRAGDTITLQTGIAAIERLGSGLRLASRPVNFFGPGRHDGAELGWDMFWDTPCKCARYVGAGSPMR